MFQSKMKDAFWGFIVGDAFGLPYEFVDRDDTRSNPAKEMIGHGTFNQPVGTWSDDTSMMLCVMENIYNRGDMSALSQLFIQWYRDGYNTPHGEAFDIGNTTQVAIERLMQGEIPSRSGSSDERSAGNGSLMRTVPYVFTTRTFQEMMLCMTYDHHITHRLPICMDASFFYAHLLKALADGQIKEDAMKIAGDYVQFGWRIMDHKDEDSFMEYTKKFQRLIKNDFAMLKEEDISSSGYVMDTLEASIWSFLNSTSYSDAILRAVNLGQDTDTIAALTGALAGVYYGYDSIPKDWLNRIVGKETIKNRFSFL